MPRVTLQFEDRTLKHYDVGLSLTIGRLPDNTIVIDNPAVSGHHACIFRDGDQFILEDLESTNGTYIGESYVTRRTLKNGDVVLVGKHKLVFDEMAGSQAGVAENNAPSLPRLNETMYLDTRKHREMLAELREAQRTQVKESAGAPQQATLPSTVATPARVALLRVLAGRADESEYNLEARTSVIGRSDGALIRLRGWFKPKVALAIARNDGAYVATPIEGKTVINSEPLSGRRDLKDGDILQVAGLTLEFRFNA